MSHRQWITRARRGAIIALTALTALGCPEGDDDDDDSYDISEINLTPIVTIIRPAVGAVYSEDETVTLEATATDSEDGALQGDGLAWSSSISGALGTGSPVDVTLQPGLHDITVTATDSDNAVATATRKITVLPDVYGGQNEDPVVTIFSPQALGVFDLGETIRMQGSANDPEEGQLSGNQLVWKAFGRYVTLELGTGNQIDVDDLEVGWWRVRLEATDSYGATGQASIAPPILIPQQLPACPAGALTINPSPIRVTAGQSGAAAYEDKDPQKCALSRCGKVGQLES